MAASRIERLIAERTAQRRFRAVRGALAVLDALTDLGVDAYVIGSLASGWFMVHSDVDFLVVGRIDPMRRRVVEAAIGEAMGGSGVGYDVVYEEDLKEEVLEEFRHDKADASRILEIAHQVGAA